MLVLAIVLLCVTVLFRPGFYFADMEAQGITVIEKVSISRLLEI